MAIVCSTSDVDRLCFIHVPKPSDLTTLLPTLKSRTEDGISDKHETPHTATSSSDCHSRFLDVRRARQRTRPSNMRPHVRNGCTSYLATLCAIITFVASVFAADTTPLDNNTPINSNILPNSTNYYEFPLTTISQSRRDDTEQLDQELEQHYELRKRQTTSANVYITINTCLQPISSDGSQPPQLTLWVSQSNPSPGPSSTQSTQQVVLEQGYANITLSEIQSDVFLGISADTFNATSGVWNYEIAASTDQNYHSWDSGLPALYMSDSDPNAALLVTQNFSAAIPAGLNSSDVGPQLSLFVQQTNSTNDTAISGLEKSYCGLKMNARIQGILPDIASGGIETSITEYGEQIFYVPNLNATSTYTAILARAANTTSVSPGGGGTVYNTTTFITKKLANCQIIYGLSFCSTVAYAVPANPANFSTMSALAAQYDNSTWATYQGFNYSLQQIACNTTSTAQYSLVKNCDDCAAAYKNWICAVSIPRCDDWTNPGDSQYPLYSGAQQVDSNGNAVNYLMPRNAAQPPIPATANLTMPVTDPTLLNWVAFNSSRNSQVITNNIAPGPYMEVLPCQDLCYDLVRSCPAALGFLCPKTGRGLEWSYGTRRATADGAVTCNAPGAVWGVSEGNVGHVNWTLLFLSLLCVATALIAN